MQRLRSVHRDPGIHGRERAGPQCGVPLLWKRKDDPSLHRAACTHPFGPRRPSTTKLWGFGLRVLRMTMEALEVCVFIAPDASCGTGMTWSAACAFTSERLKRRFGDAVRVEHIELFGPRTFDFPQVVAAIEGGAPLPIVTVGGQIVSQGGKLSERIIAQAIETRSKTEKEA